MPDTDILNEEQVREIETRDSTCLRGTTSYLDRIVLTVAERDALCRTLRAAWAKYDAEDKDHRLTIDTFRQQERIWQQKFDEQKQENAALREQLAQYEQCVTCVACGRPSWHRKGDEPL